MNQLNLLLRHQIIKNSSMNTPQETYYEEQYSTSFVVPKKATYNDSLFEDSCDELKAELAKIQLEESSALEQHKALLDSYELLETIMEHLLNHLECTLLEIRSTSRLCSFLNTYLVKEQCIDEKISSTLKLLSETYNSSTLDKLKGKLLTMLNDNNSSVKKLHSEFLERQSNYNLALKNFKIILEILNVNDDSLRKLKQQFDEVLMDYQHCRCIVDHELPFAISQRTEVLADCLVALGAEFDTLADRRTALSVLLSDVGRRKLEENEYILVKKQVLVEDSNNEDRD